MKEIALGNSWTFCHYGVHDNADTGASEAATGIADLVAHLSLEPGGTAIHDDLSKPLVERASKPGEYFATVTGSKLTEHLTDDEGELLQRVIYEVFRTDDTVLYSVPRRLVKHRGA